MYSTYDQEKSVAVGRFIRTLKNKIYEYMTSVSQCSILILQLDDMVNKYNNIYHSTIKMKPLDVKSSACIDFAKVLKFKVSNHVKGSK